MRRWLLVVALLLAGCATTPTVPTPLPPTTPAAACDFRMVDHNRRACAERPGFTFTDPTPAMPCGACAR